MNNIIYFYQNIPLRINPTAFGIGFFQIGWYALSYLLGFAVVYGLLRYRIKRGEGKDIISNLEFRISKKIPNTKHQIQNSLLDSFFLYAIPAILIGGRLGYVLFYNLPFYLKHPVEIISPYNFSTHIWSGIYGMSYHGGLVALILVAIWFCKKNKIYPVKSSAKAEVSEGKFNRVNFFDFSDFIVPAVPAGYFFGRLGNFMNGELYGRITKSLWGMYFFDGKSIFLRYPSQLIEAFLEGIIIFIILWIFRNKLFLKGKIIFLYIFLYGLARFLAEFFREPDEQIGYIWNWLTLGQIFSLGMIVAGSILFFGRRWYNVKYETLNSKL